MQERQRSSTLNESSAIVQQSMKQQAIVQKIQIFAPQRRLCVERPGGARELGLQTGTPVYVVQGGQIVDLTRQKRMRGRIK